MAGVKRKSRLTKTNNFIIKNGRRMYLFLCDCGNEKYILLSNVNSGKVISCGCYISELTTIRNRIKNYSVSHGYFSKINTEDKAYWLGFLSADGCVTGKHSIQLELANIDYSHLEKFVMAIKSTYPIYNYSKSSLVKVFSEKMEKDLLRYGVTRRKSLTANFNIDIISKKFHKDFWRGYIDGDGSLFITSENKKVLSVAGTFDTCTKLSTFIKSNGIEVNNKVNRQRNFFTINFNGDNAKRVTSLIYKNSKIYLDRKYLKYEEIVGK